MQTVRTPDARFENLPDYPFEPHYAEVSAADGTALRLHYVDEGPRDGEVILCMHGQPSWSFLYRKMIPILVAAGYRVLAPDLIGFGKSDKPTERSDYSYSGHVDWIDQWFNGLDLSNVTLVCQDWGGLIGLRVASQNIDRFARLVIANTGLPDSKAVAPEMSAMLEQAMPQIPVPSAQEVTQQFSSGSPAAFLYWVKYAGESPDFSVRAVFQILSDISDEAVLDGYAAPFPDESYNAGAREFPSLVPLMPHHADERAKNDAAWKVLEAFDRPVLVSFSNDDPVTKASEEGFKTRIAGAQNQQHASIENGGHFLQEKQPEAFSKAIIDFMVVNPL